MEDSVDRKLEKYVTEQTYKLLAGSKANFSKSIYQYIPSAYYPNLVEDDYINGMFFRYFTRKSNNINATPIEISKEEYFENANVSPFYTCTYIAWKITGSLYDQYDDDGILQYQGVIPFNERQLELAKEQKNLRIGIKNPLEFYKKD